MHKCKKITEHLFNRFNEVASGLMQIQRPCTSSAIISLCV